MNPLFPKWFCLHLIYRQKISSITPKYGHFWNFNKHYKTELRLKAQVLKLQFCSLFVKLNFVLKIRKLVWNNTTRSERRTKSNRYSESIIRKNLFKLLNIGDNISRIRRFWWSIQRNLQRSDKRRSEETQNHLTSRSQ